MTSPESKIPLNIDIISDVVCPWCVIGYGRLKKALEKYTDTIEVNISWHPFELNPNMPSHGENLREHLANKYGTTLEGSIKARAMLTEEGEKFGFTFNYFDEMKMLNTHQCHQILHWAKESERQSELAEALFTHYFSDHGEFTESELLILINQVGLDAAEASNILSNNTLSNEVQSIEQYWRNNGIQGVPLFIFNGRKMLSGAQETETFESLLNQILN